MTSPAPSPRRARVMRRVGSATAALAVGALVLSGCASGDAGGGDEAKNKIGRAHV